MEHLRKVQNDRAGSTQLAEDLRLERGEQAVLVNVAGRDHFMKQSSINQLAAHQRRYLSATGKHTDQVHSLLIANFNYKGGRDPRQRGSMFGTGTVEAAERLEAEGFGAMSTFSLYGLILAIQRGEVTLTTDLLWRFLQVVGIADVAQIVATVQTGPGEIANKREDNTPG